MTTLWVGNINFGIERYTFIFRGTVAASAQVNIPITHPIDIPNLSAGYTSQNSNNYTADNICMHLGSTSGGGVGSCSIVKMPGSVRLAIFAIMGSGTISSITGAEGGGVVRVDAGETLRLTIVKPADPVTWITMANASFTIKAYRRS